jgi:alkanesulfonate monooxygenase SsuD/methylene tetrahydromethanopterin reductase-like flavin-dependent oxidoreductase (luciferase family)
MQVEIGVILPTSTPDPAQPILADVRASARFAEEAGLDSVWCTDHLLASAPDRKLPHLEGSNEPRSGA